MAYRETTISFEVDRPLTDDEMNDVRQAIEQIMEKRSFFFASDDDIGDEIRRFMIDHPMTTNLEEVPAE